MSASVTGGVAPLPVFFDATGTTPKSSLHRLKFEWDFGDSSAVRASARGFTAAHVYEVPGTYVAWLTVTDGTAAPVRKSVIITVTAFAGTTFYVSGSGNDTGPGTLAQPLRTFDEGMRRLKTALQPGPKPIRLLFNRGDRFVTRGSSLNHYMAGTPAIISAYGSGPKPIIQNIGGDDDFTWVFGFQNAGFRWVDLDLRGRYDFAQDSGPNTTHVYLPDETRDMLMLRVSCSESGQLFIVGGGSALDRRELFVMDCDVQEVKEVAIYLAGRNVAAVGNTVNKSSLTHLLRVWWADRAVISHNTLLDPSYNHPLQGRHALKLHGDSNGQNVPTRFVAVSDNEFKGSTWSVMVAPQDTGSREPIEDVILERNHFIADPRTRRTLMIQADDVTVRNNTFEVDPASQIDEIELIALSPYPLMPAPSRIHVYNNTAVDTRADSNTVRFFEFQTASSTDIQVRNNVFSAPNRTGQTTRGLRYPNAQSLRNLTASNNVWHLPLVQGGHVVEDRSTLNAMTLPQWLALNQGAGSSILDPKFESVTRGHFAPMLGGAAVDAGAAIPEVFDGMDGMDRINTGALDIGAFEAGAGGGAKLSAVPSRATPGTTVRLPIDAPGAPGFAYRMGLSFSTYPAIRAAGGVVIPLAQDNLFDLSQEGDPALLVNFGGILDASGQGEAQLVIPQDAALRGLAFYAAAVAWRAPNIRVTNAASILID